jgi:hypothetical protein
MTIGVDHLTAARLSKCGVALRMDGELLVICRPDAGLLAIAKDPEGDLWQNLDPAEAYRYKDWEPAPDNTWEAICRAWRRVLRTLKRWVPFRT